MCLILKLSNILFGLSIITVTRKFAIRLIKLNFLEVVQLERLGPILTGHLVLKMTCPTNCESLLHLS